ncbi:aminotransferase class I/II-fold pyridoxal phosphate-dependent enzyme [Selenomonas sp. TAMA-11512]|uniref:trans-sulfuration enzyme family protein n=1 Tax=Selenomonas sp. TAMA-11512 TaxID=3095337 RepID=UPI003091305E|nr:aminotransferase class I/II-fold pyridoxal phosphate-dependent enzyme [Selenomonas sp. TAMA-11512]
MKDFSLEVRGCHKFDATGAISEPIYLSATYRHPAFRQSTGFDYGRVANPTRQVLEETIAALEHGSRAWAVSSGMAAIQLVLQLFKPGDHVLLSEDLYGGIVRLASIYERYGVYFEYVDTRDLAVIESRIRPETRGIFIETPSNPMMFVSDIRGIAKLAHANNALFIVDNTFLSPHFQRPLDLGADIIIHSGTKYLCGHNDVICGFLITKGGLTDIESQVELLAKSAGPTLSALDAWLMLRSIKTLGIRVERQSESALHIAHFLKTLPEVTDVYYVGLPEHPGHELHKSQAAGFGGMISFKVRTPAIARNVLEHLKFIIYAESLGGIETLLTYPLVQTHAEMPKELIERTGLDDYLLRLSVGIEDAEDIEQDLQQALASAAK